MIIAREKKKTNIAEYILYMWQIEDIIRACNFNIDIIEKRIIKEMKMDNILHEEAKIWYADLIEKMKGEGIEGKGHLSFVNENVEKLEKLHNKLLSDKKEEKYTGLYSWAKSNIDALHSKSETKETGEVETCLTGLYGLLILRLRKKTISEETTQALQTISNLIAYLSQKFIVEDQ